jgi:hypothetical protein
MKQAKPLRNLRRSRVALWSPILATLDFTKTFIVECDASKHDIGATAMQEGRPLSIKIHQLKGKNLLKTIYKKEMLYAVKQWPPYLMGKHLR